MSMKRRLKTALAAAALAAPAAAPAGETITYSYDDLGRRTSLSRGNGTGTSYSFDPASRLSQLVENLGGTANDLTLGFSYNPAIQITQNTRSNDGEVYPECVEGLDGAQLRAW